MLLQKQDPHCTWRTNSDSLSKLLGSVSSCTTSDTISEVTTLQVSVGWIVYVSLLTVAGLTLATTTVLNSVVGTVPVPLTTVITMVLIVV